MKQNVELQKLIVLLGPTASGKTDWSLRLAKLINGEIISADSRQIYKKMDIGTAKEPGEWKWHAGWKKVPRRTYYIQDIPHHLMDFLNPGKTFTVAEFRDRTVKYAKMAHKCERTPMLVGGTGLYIQSVVDNYAIPRIEPNKKLRKSLDEKSTKELIQLLTQLDPDVIKTIDLKNRRRLIRALEVCIFTGVPFSKQQKKGEPLFDTLQIGIDIERAELDERINTRVDHMMEAGLLDEVKKLRKQKYGWNLSSMSGVGYRQFKSHLEGDATLEEVVELLKRDTRRFARRQMTWFRRDKRIHWVKTYEEAEALVQRFLKK